MAGQARKGANGYILRIPLPESTGLEQQKLIADEIIEYIKTKTKSGINPGTGRGWAGKAKSYTPEYGKSAPVDLTATNSMLASLQYIPTQDRNSITIGVSSSQVGKAQGNNEGTYGGKSDGSRKRPFMSYTKAALNEAIRRSK